MKRFEQLKSLYKSMKNDFSVHQTNRIFIIAITSSFRENDLFSEYLTTPKKLNNDNNTESPIRALFVIPKKGKEEE